MVRRLHHTPSDSWRSAIALLVALAGCGIAEVAPRARPPIAAVAPSVAPAAPAPTPCEHFMRPPSSPSREDAVVRVYSPWGACSGALIAPDRVLTAHHCLDTDQGSHARAEDLRVQFGANSASSWGDVGVRQVVVDDASPARGGGDLAILLLQRDVRGVSPLAVRMGSPPKIDDLIEAVGFGACDDMPRFSPFAPSGSSGLLLLRNTRSGTAQTIGQAVYAGVESCAGDSGGPLLDANGELVGVVSGALSLTPAELALGMRPGAPLTVASRVDAYRSLFARADAVGPKPHDDSAADRACGF